MKNLYLFVLALWITHMTNAQEPMNASDLNTTIGTQFEQYSVMGDFIGSPGTDQIWDFSNLLPEVDVTVSTFEYGITGGETHFPNANSVWSFDSDSFFWFYQIDDQGFSYHGSYEEGGIVISYPDPSVHCAFPVVMGEAFEDTFTFQSIGDEGPGTATGMYSAEVDGHGVLQLPWGDIPACYRVHGTQTQEQEVEVQGITTTAYYDGTFTSFFAPGYPGPLLQVRSGELTIPEVNFSQSQSITTYLGSFEFLGVDEVEIVQDLKVFPNPSHGQFSLTFENKVNRNISLEVLDIQGRLVYSQAAIGSGFGSARQEIDLGDLTPGFYLLRLSDGVRFQGRKVQVVR